MAGNCRTCQLFSSWGRMKLAIYTTNLTTRAAAAKQNKTIPPFPFPTDPLASIDLQASTNLW